MTMPSLNRARLDARLRLGVGVVGLLMCTLLLLVALLKGLYGLTQTNADPAFSLLAANVAGVIRKLYAAVAVHAPSLAAWLWASAAPDINLRAALFASEQRGLWLLYATLFGCAATVRRARARLSQLAQHKQWVAQIEAEERIRKRVRGPQGSARAGASERQTVPPSPPPKWQTTWWGVLFLAVAAGVATDIIKLLLGLSKLP